MSSGLGGLLAWVMVLQPHGLISMSTPEFGDQTSVYLISWGLGVLEVSGEVVVPSFRGRGMSSSSACSAYRSLLVPHFLIWSMCQLHVQPSCSWISKDSGPVCALMCPGNNHSPCPIFRRNTSSPTAKLRVLQCWSWSSLCLSCFSRTRCWIFGWRQSSLERSLWPKSNYARENPVVECL